MSGRHPPLTIHRRLGHGAVLRHGRSAALPGHRDRSTGEPHLVRDDFIRPGPEASAEAPTVRGAGRRCSAWLTSPTCSSPTSSRRRGSSSSTPASPTPVRRDHPGAASAGGAHRARRRRHHPHARLAVHGPATGAPPQLVGHHRRRDRQRAVERAAGLPGPVRRRPGVAGFRRPRLRGSAGAGLAGRHLLAAGRAGRRRARLLPSRVRLPAPPRPAGTRAARVLRRRPEHPLAVLLRQSRGAQPGRRHSDARPRRPR